MSAPSLSRLPVAVLLGLTLGACDRGDWFPPERAARELFNGWDMWETEAVSPFRGAMPRPPRGAVPFFSPPTLESARAELEAMGSQPRARRAAETYRRYCHHCHGPNGDGRIIVGESFAPALPDLRAPASQARPEGQLYRQVMRGGRIMIPLDDTLTPLDALLALEHVRTLAQAPSRPFFAPRSDEPIR